jgi:hypothetical protein
MTVQGVETLLTAYSVERCSLQRVELGLTRDRSVQGMRTVQTLTGVSTETVASPDMRGEAGRGVRFNSYAGRGAVLAVRSQLGWIVSNVIVCHRLLLTHRARRTMCRRQGNDDGSRPTSRQNPKCVRFATVVPEKHSTLHRKVAILPSIVRITALLSVFTVVCGADVQADFSDQEREFRV